MRTLITLLRGKRTYFVAIIGLLYVSGYLLGFWELNDGVLAAFGLGGLAFLRAGVGNEVRRWLEQRYPLAALLGFCAGLVFLTSGCAGGPGGSAGVSVDGQQTITGTAAVDLSSNVTVQATVSGNPQTGAVSGGILVTFNRTPSAGTVALLSQVGATPARSGLVWMLAKWDYRDARQGAALESALREGAVLSRP